MQLSPEELAAISDIRKYVGAFRSHLYDGNLRGLDEDELNEIAEHLEHANQIVSNKRK